MSARGQRPKAGDERPRDAATGKLKRLPNPLRARCSCPDCGMVIDDEAAPWSAELLIASGFTPAQAAEHATSFECPRCGAAYDCQSFWDAHREKLQALHSNHAQADLSGEEDE